MSFLSTLSQHRCYCLFDCECNKVGRLISEWTSQEAFETVKKRLLNLTDPTEIFARFACILFYREILDGTLLKCKRDNLRKASIAFSFASSFANEEFECSTFYATCWERFHELATELDEELNSIRHRHRMNLLFFIEYVFPMDSAKRNCGPQPHGLLVSPASDSANDSTLLQPRQTENSGAEVSDGRATLANGVVTIYECKDEEKKTPAQVPPRSATVSQEPVATNRSASSKSPNLQTSGQSERTDHAETKQEHAELAEGDADQSATPAPSASVTCPTEPTKTAKRSACRDGCDGETRRKRVRFSLPLMNVGTSSGIASSATSSSTGKNGWHKCPIAGCKLTFKFEWMIDRHLRQNDWKGRTIFYTCDECGMDFVSPLTLRTHRNVHKRNNRLECQECDFHYEKNNALTIHRKFVHGGRRC